MSFVSGTTGGVTDHTALTNVTPDEHHNQSHADSDHTGANKGSYGTSASVGGAYTEKGVRTELGFYFGSGITGSVADDVTHTKVDVSIASAVQRIPRTADAAARNSGNTGTTLTNDDTLLWTTPGNSTAIWLMEAFLLLSGANATMDGKFGFSGPSGATAYWGLASTGQGATVAGFGGMTPSTAITALLAIGGNQPVATANGVVGISLAGIFFDGGTSGNIVLQWAQNTADAGDLKLLKGSCLRITPLVA